MQTNVYPNAIGVGGKPQSQTQPIMFSNEVWLTLNGEIRVSSAKSYTNQEVLKFLAKSKEIHRILGHHVSGLLR